MILTQTQKDEFVKKNLGLVHSCANKFKGRHIEYDDLFSAGCMGLLKAISGFDESRGLMFSTYAVPVILGEIKRLFRDGGAIKVSRSLKELSLKISRERERFSKINFREPTINELAETLCVSTDDVVQAINVSIAPMSLTVSDEDNEFDIPTECMDEKIIDRLTLKNAITSLNIQDKNLIILRYFKNQTQTQTAKILGMTQVQVSRKEKKLLTTLKIKMST